MYIKNLKLRNIGPFDEAHIEFAYNIGDDTRPPVTIITGLNGAGKSIVIDALRTALSGEKIERNIVADPDNFFIGMTVDYGSGFKEVSTNKMSSGLVHQAEWQHIAKPLTVPYKNGDEVFPWVVDYWSSQLPSDSFSIKNMSTIDHGSFMAGAMLGRRSNVNLTNFLCSIDYMRTSEETGEKRIAEYMYDIIKSIINECLDNGEFKYIRRSDLMPIIEQNGHPVSLDKLSSGNIFLIEHIVMLVCKMYSLSVLRKTGIDGILSGRGLLLIDEIETHLHPQWQKSVLPIICRTFPNLQIILTTHSPFVLSSLPGARIYTCKPQTGCSVIEDETEMYSNMSVEEILLSNAFNVPPFSNDITDKVRRRKAAVMDGDKKEADRLADELIEINPDHFLYLKLSRDNHESHDTY